MKCCHLTSVHPYSDTRIFVKECSSLAKAGFDVTLIAPAEKDVVINGVKIIAVKKPSSRFMRVMTTVNDVYRKALAVDAGIYHFHDPELIRIGLKLKRKGKKVIYDVHEDVPRQLLAKYYLPEFSRRSISERFEKYEDDAAKRFDQIIVVTPLLEQRFKALNKNTTQVCNFPSLEEFGVTETSWSKRKKETCYVGGISVIRGIREMVNALENTDTTLHLAGSFSPPSLRDEIKKMDGWSRVMEHGFLSREKIRQLLSTSRIGLVLLHPTENYIDAYPVKMFEYMAAGMPVVASDFPSWKQMVEQYHCGICVNPMNVPAITDAINFLISHDEEAEQMGINGRKAVVEKFNWQVEEKKLLDIYRTL